jgi:hypothetical protein
MLRLLFVLSFLAACVPAQKESLTTGAATNPNAPSAWSKAGLPKQIFLSHEFSNAEATELTDAVVSWNTHGTYTFSTVSSTKVNDRSSVNNLNSLFDGEFGIYKAVNWHPQLPSTALAVTQIFGVRQNVGTASEFVEIVEGDILINWTFPYAPTNPNGYDLFTVTLHEMGHFLGLGHITNYALQSVMYPSSGYSTFYLRPGSEDIRNIKNKYSIGVQAMAARSPASSSPQRAPATKEFVENSPDAVKIIMELHVDGTCRHYTNDVLQSVHKIK